MYSNTTPTALHGIEIEGISYDGFIPDISPEKEAELLLGCLCDAEDETVQDYFDAMLDDRIRDLFSAGTPEVTAQILSKLEKGQRAEIFLTLKASDREKVLPHLKMQEAIDAAKNIDQMTPADIVTLVMGMNEEQRKEFFTNHLSAEQQSSVLERLELHSVRGKLVTIISQKPPAVFELDAQQVQTANDPVVEEEKLDDGITAQLPPPQPVEVAPPVVKQAIVQGQKPAKPTIQDIWFSNAVRALEKDSALKDAAVRYRKAEQKYEAILAEPKELRASSYKHGEKVKSAQNKRDKAQDKLTETFVRAAVRQLNIRDRSPMLRVEGNIEGNRLRECLRLQAAVGIEHPRKGYSDDQMQHVMTGKDKPVWTGFRLWGNESTPE